MEANREEIQAHIDKLNAAWQAYDRIADNERLWQRRARLNDAWMAEVTWLAEHGLCDLELAYNSETLTYALPEQKKTPVTSP